MTETPEEITAQPTEEVQPAEAAVEQKKNMFTDDDVEKILKGRMKQKDRQIEDLQRKFQELEQKVSQGTATQSEQLQLQASKNQANQTAQQVLDPDLIMQAADQRRREVEFNNKLDDAMEKDPEFKKLASERNELGVPPQFMGQMLDIDNAPAVLKHLLKNKKDNKLMFAAAEEGRKSFLEFIYGVSEKLESSASKPAPNPYTPAPTLSDSGDSSQEFDLEEYVKNKRV